ncbi:hypothetical protein [Massilia sp. SYSU DXS3249]
MISEFQDLSDKIEQLAALVGTLRNENAQLLQTNVLLNEVNTALVERLVEAQNRIEAVIAQLPAPESDEAGDAEADGAEDDEPMHTEAAR